MVEMGCSFDDGCNGLRAVLTGLSILPVSDVSDACEVICRYLTLLGGFVEGFDGSQFPGSEGLEVSGGVQFRPVETVIVQ